MKRKMPLFILATVIAVSTLSIIILANTSRAGMPDISSDSSATGQGVVVIPEKYQAPNAASAAPIKGTPVYFTPQDENTSTTVLFLYNTNSVDKTVALQSFYLDGSKTIDTTILVPANGLVRICSDSVSTVSASWQNFILVNFTTFSAYAKLILPKGVKVEGYIAYDPSGVYDPLASTPMLPLRFSVGTATTP